MKTVFRITILLIVFGFSNSHIGYSDTPPYWDEYVIYSPNKVFLAEIKIVDEQDNVLKLAEGDLLRQFLKYQLTVYRNSESKESVWTTDYVHTGYSEGILSDDGKFFVYLDPWFAEDHSVVFIYTEDQDLIKIYGKKFNITPDSLIKTVSHHLWLDSARFLGGNKLQVQTVDGRIHQIDLLTGKFVK